MSRRQFWILPLLLFVIWWSTVFQPNAAAAVGAAKCVQEDKAGDLSLKAIDLYKKGDISHALELLNKALKIYRDQHYFPGEEMTLNSIGVIYFSIGEYARALDYLNQGLAGALKVGDRDGVETGLKNIGDVYIALDRFPEALKSFQDALEVEDHIFGVAGVPRPAEKANLLRNIGGVYAALGQHKKGLDFYRRALEMMGGKSSTWFREDIGEVLASMGAIYAVEGESEKALEAFGEALRIAQQTGNPVLTRVALTNLGSVNVQVKQYATALQYLQQAVVIDRQVGDRLSEGGNLSMIGGVYRLQGQQARALESCQAGLKIANQVRSPNLTMMALYQIGLIYEDQNKLQEALQIYQQCIAEMEKVRTASRLEEFKLSLAELSVDVYQRVTFLFMRLAKPSLAFDFAEQARARALLDQLGNVHLDALRGADANLAQKEQALRRQLRKLASLINQERSQQAPRFSDEAIKKFTMELDRKQTEYEELLTQVKLANPEYASLVSLSPISLAQVQKLLSKDTTLLVYVVTSSKTLAFVVTDNSFQAVELPVSEKELRDAIVWFRSFSNLRNVPQQSLKQLHEWLIAPVEPYIKTPIVGIIPHGVLHYLPFSALSDGQHYFGESHTLFYLPSASVVPFIQKKTRPLSSQVLAIAQSRAEGFPILQYADGEAQTVASLYGTKAVTTGNATKQMLLAQSSNYTVLHIAAHAELNTSSPLFSRILLAADQNNDPGLEVREIYGLDLSKTSLVVLSACETQLGAQSKGDDIIGLSRAFIYAGTPTVVASLWTVDDEATGFLMKSFYTHLKEGMGKAEALREAQKETRAMYPHPYYWAAFVLTGDPNR
jgi:CHAT domain-containing protein/Tfp pilus assembly protein PilF